MTFEQIIEILPSRRLELDLPLELPLGKARLELKIIPEKAEQYLEKKSAFGCLNNFANPAKIPGEKDAWVRSVIEKYAKN
jgi:hypothetical protein